MPAAAHPTDVRALARLLSQPVTEDLPRLDHRLIDLADAHGVTPLLDHVVTQAGLRSALRPEARDRLARATREAVVLDAVARDHNRAVLTALAAAHLDVLVFKGAALADSHYPATWLRPRGDLDLLVPIGQVQAASRTLERAGCRKAARPVGDYVTAQACYVAESAGTTVTYDLHWRLSDPQAFAGALDHATLWADAQPSLVTGVRLPSAVHALLIACIHRAAHHLDTDRLLLLCDVDRLARRLSPDEWDQFLAFARARRLLAVCRRALDLAGLLLQTPVPTPVRAALAAATTGEPTARFVTGTMRKVDVLQSDLARLPTWRARARLILEHLFPPRSYMAVRYGSRHPLLSPGFVLLLYGHRIATGVTRWFRPIH